MYQDTHTQAPGAAAQPAAVNFSEHDLSREDFDAYIARGHTLRAQACGELGQRIAHAVCAGWQTLRRGFRH